MLLFLKSFLHPLVCLSLLIPLVLDGGIQLLFNVLSNNARRFVTGTLFGIGFIQLIAAIFMYLF